MANELGKLFVKIDADTQGLNKALGAAEGKSRSFADKFGKHMKIAGAAMVGLAGAVAVGSLKMAADFEKGMREVNTMMGLSQTEFAEFSKEVLGLSKNLGVDAVGATEALYQAISAGVPKENVIDFLAIASKLAIGGVTDTMTAVDGLTTVINAFKLPMSDAQHISDVMFQTVKGGKTNMEELSKTIFNVAPIAASAGVEFETVAAALATMTKQGVPTSVATTQLRQAIVAIMKPTADMTKVIDELGFESGQAMLSELGFRDAIDLLRQSTGGSDEQLMKMFGSVEGGSAILALTGQNAQTFASDLDAIGQASEGVGAATRAFEEMESSTSRQMEKMKVQMKDTFIVIGTALIPALLKVVEAIKPIIEKVVAWIEANPQLTVAILAVVAAVGALLLILPTLMTALPLLGAAFTVALGPVGLIIAAIAALVAVGVLVYKNWDTIKEKAVEIWTSIAEFFTQIWGKITGIFEQNWDKILAIIFPPIGLPILIARNWEAIQDVTEETWGKIAETVGLNWGDIVDTCRKKLDAVLEAFHSFKWLFGGEVSDWFSEFSHAMEMLFGVAIGKKIDEFILKILDACHAVVGYFRGITDKVKQWWENFKQWLGSLNPWEWMKKGWESITSGVQGVLDTLFGSGIIPEKFDSIARYMENYDFSYVAAEAFGTIRTAAEIELKNTADLTRQAFNDIAEEIGDMIIPYPKIEDPPEIPAPKPPKDGEPEPPPEPPKPPKTPDKEEMLRILQETLRTGKPLILPHARMIVDRWSRVAEEHGIAMELRHRGLIRCSHGDIIPYFEKGGIVTRPTFGILGEKGPEAVVPLEKGTAGLGESHFHFEGCTFLGKEEEAREWAMKLLKVLRQETRGLYGTVSF